MRLLFHRYANGHIPELYSLSLRNLYFGTPRGGYPDVTAIDPIPGRYIANQELSTNPQSPYIMTDPNARNTVIVTKITHNSGASWVRPGNALFVGMMCAIILIVCRPKPVIIVSMITYNLERSTCQVDHFCHVT